MLAPFGLSIAVNDMTAIYQATRGTVCAGFDVKDDRVVRCAPILKRVILGKKLDEAKRLLRKSGYTIIYVEDVA